MTSPDRYSHTQYLRAKASIDARALHAGVWDAFTTALTERLTAHDRLTVLEVGGGIGTMAQWVLDAMLTSSESVNPTYILVDQDSSAIQEAQTQLHAWGRDREGKCTLSDRRLWMEGREGRVEVKFVEDDIFDYLEHRSSGPVDITIGQAVLDMFNLPRALDVLSSRTTDLLYLPINFDGITSFTPLLPHLDEQIEEAYHRSMERRRTQHGPIGGSKSGRRLLELIVGDSTLDLIEAGPSDWIVLPNNGEYTGSKKRFLAHMLHTIEQELREGSTVRAETLSSWMDQRRVHLKKGVLTLTAHQIDVLAQVS
jgi:hypothetical protein